MSSSDVATIMSGLATTMGLKFVNSGVQVKLSNPYFPGTGRDQVERCATAANFSWVIDRGTLAIWPQDGARGSEAPLTSPQTGLVGYPAYDSLGIVLRTFFNHSISSGGLIKVQSSQTLACGLWGVSNLFHELEAEMPGSQWFSAIRAVRPGTAPFAQLQDS